MLTGKTAIITGGNSGIGFETAKGLLQMGANIILAVRNTEKGEAARAALSNLYPTAQIDVIQLDLADLESIRAFAERFKNSYDKLDILINNAGLMAPPYAKTKDGFEMQFAKTLLLGVIVSLFSALLVTRFLMKQFIQLKNWNVSAFTSGVQSAKEAK